MDKFHVIQYFKDLYKQYSKYNLIIKQNIGRFMLTFLPVIVVVTFGPEQSSRPMISNSEKFTPVAETVQMPHHWMLSSLILQCI